MDIEKDRFEKEYMTDYCGDSFIAQEMFCVWYRENFQREHEMKIQPVPGRGPFIDSQFYLEYKCLSKMKRELDRHSYKNRIVKHSHPRIAPHVVVDLTPPSIWKTLKLTIFGWKDESSLCFQT